MRQRFAKAVNRVLHQGHLERSGCEFKFNVGVLGRKFSRLYQQPESLLWLTISLSFRSMLAEEVYKCIRSVGAGRIESDGYLQFGNSFRITA